MNELIDRFNAVPLTNKIIVLFLVMILLAAGYVIGLHLPMNEEIADLQTQAVELAQEQRDLQDVHEQQAQVERKIEELQDELLRAEDKLPDTAEIPGLLERIYRDAEMQGLTIETFQRHEERDAEGADYVEIPVEMELVGSFDEIANFFAEVGQRGRIINIEDIELNRQSSDLSPDGTLNVSAWATTYRWSPEEES